MIKRFTNYVKNEDSEEEVFFSVPKKEVNQPEIEIKEKPNEKKEKKEEPIKYRTYRFCKLCGQKLYSEQDFISHTSSPPFYGCWSCCYLLLYCLFALQFL